MCNVDQPIRHFPGIGFRPAVEVTQRDQYGDRLIWIVGEDCATGKFEMVKFLHREHCDMKTTDSFLLECVNSYQIAQQNDMTPEASQVWLAESLLFTLTAMTVLFSRKMLAAMGRFADWFCAERGTGPGKCGWP